MDKQELQAVIANPLATEDQKTQAQSLLDKLNTKSETTADPLLVSLRKKHLQMLLDSTDAKDKQALKDLAHNWPDYGVTGKVLGE